MCTQRKLIQLSPLAIKTGQCRWSDRARNESDRPAHHPLYAVDCGAGNRLEFASLKDAALHEEQHHIAHCQYADANSDHEKKELVHAVTFWAKAPERRSVPLGNRKKAPRPNVTQADKFRAKFKRPQCGRAPRPPTAAGLERSLARQGV